MKSLVTTFVVAAFMSLSLSNFTQTQDSTEVGRFSTSQGAVDEAVMSVSTTSLSEGKVASNPTQQEYAQLAQLKAHLGDLAYENRARFVHTTYGGDRKVFVIPAAQIEKEAHLAIERDIHIMSHIFDRVLKKPVNLIGGVFNVMDDFFGRDSHVTQAIYLDGYGVLFFMNVDFVLVGSPEAPEEKGPKGSEEHVDKTWERAEQELYSPQNLKNDSIKRSGPEYDPEKVEVLKKNLVEALKHAANIQVLKADDRVILTVTGRAAPSPTVVAQRSYSSYGRSGSRYRMTATQPARTLCLSLAPSPLLTIRTKKSDIDAFSEGELDFSKFKERTQILTHWK